MQAPSTIYNFFSINKLSPLLSVKKILFCKIIGSVFILGHDDKISIFNDPFQIIASQAVFVTVRLTVFVPWSIKLWFPYCKKYVGAKTKRKCILFPLPIVSWQAFFLILLFYGYKFAVSSISTLSNFFISSWFSLSAILTVIGSDQFRVLMISKWDI